MCGQAFDGEVDDGPDGSVDAPHAPRLRWVDVRDFGGAGTVGAADAPGGEASRSHALGAGLVHLAVDDATLLPLVEAGRVGGVGELVALRSTSVLTVIGGSQLPSVNRAAYRVRYS